MRKEIKFILVLVLFIISVQLAIAQIPVKADKGGSPEVKVDQNTTAAGPTQEKAQAPAEVKKESVAINGGKAAAQNVTAPGITQNKVKKESVAQKGGSPEGKVDQNTTAAGFTQEKAQTPEEIKKESVAKAITEAAISEGSQKFEDLPSLQAKLFFFYSPTSLYDVFCKDGYITDVQLQPGEEPLFVGGGDTVRWIIDKAQSGVGDTKQWHILIKPLKPKISTNLIITTDKHSYQLRLHSSNFFNPFVGWTYPSEDKAAFIRQAAVEKKRTADTISSLVAPDKLNFGYKIEAITSWHQFAFSWMPRLAFDDGTKTYIQMSNEMKSGEAPAIFVKDVEGVQLVNYRVKDNYYIIDRIFEQAELRCGLKEVVVISRTTQK